MIVRVIWSLLFFNLFKESIHLLLKHLGQFFLHQFIQIPLGCKLICQSMSCVSFKHYNSLGSHIAQVNINIKSRFSFCNKLRNNSGNTIAWFDWWSFRMLVIGVLVLLLELLIFIISIIHSAFSILMIFFLKLLFLVVMFLMLFLMLFFVLFLLNNLLLLLLDLFYFLLRIWLWFVLDQIMLRRWVLLLLLLNYLLLMYDLLLLNNLLLLLLLYLLLLWLNDLLLIDLVNYFFMMNYLLLSSNVYLLVNLLLLLILRNSSFLRIRIVLGWSSSLSKWFNINLLWISKGLLTSFYFLWIPLRPILSKSTLEFVSIFTEIHYWLWLTNWSLKLWW